MQINLVKLKKVILILLMIMLVCSICIVPTFSATGLQKANGAFENDETPKAVNDIMNDTIGMALTISRIVGATIAIVMLLAISIKYMVSSAGDRADIKKHAVAYIVGAFLLFAVPGVIDLLVKLSKTINVSE